MKKFIFLCFLILSPMFLFSQSITSPPATNFSQNLSNQNASGFSLSNFNTSTTLLVTIGLVNPPSGTTLSLTSTTGISLSTGYSSWLNFTRISFTGLQSNINTALSSLKVNTASLPGNVYIAVSATVNPTGYYYLPTNGHFYRPMSWPAGNSGTSNSIYTNIKTLSTQQTFKGQTGYLLTITSQDEQNFVQANVPGNNILFALTDVSQEGVWRIDAGPENGTIIKTSNSGGNVVGKYNNWCSGEPNNWGSGENYAVTKWSGGNCWNDYGPPASSFPGSISGYVIEFGTWSDPSDQNFTDFYTGFVTHQITCTPAQEPTKPIGVNGNITGSGTVTLSAIVSVGQTVDWYSNLTGGNPILVNSTTFTTPVITQTTKYYAQSRNLSTGCVSSTRTEVVASVSISETISGVVTISNNTLNRPQLKFYLVENNTETLLQTINVNTDGSYVLNPTKHNSIYKIVPIFFDSLTNNDFNLLFNESKNENTPNQLPIGLILNNGKKLKSGDINNDGKITIADAYLLAARISRLVYFNETLWYYENDFNSITINNFNLIPSYQQFMINFGTTNVILNMKYIVRGDCDLSISSY
jgi:hypothetical protein